MADNRVLWIGDLHEKVTEELLYELFLQAGPVERVKIPKDHNGKNKKYGFVDFKHEESVPYTMQLFEGVSLFGQFLKIQTRSGSSLESPRGNNNSYKSPQYSDNREPFRPQGYPPGSSPDVLHSRGMGHYSPSPTSYQQDTYRSKKGQDQGPRSFDNQSYDKTEHERRPHDHGSRSYQSRDQGSWLNDSRPHGSRQYGRDPGSRMHDAPSVQHSSSRYQRSHTWHGGERAEGQYTPPDSQSPICGRSPQHQSDILESDVQRQRVLQQQSLSLTMNRQGHDGKGRRDYDRMQPYKRSQSHSRKRY